MASPSAYSDSGVARRPTTLPLAPSEFFYRSQPGLGDILGARVLAEFGDDPARYADAKARKNYSGMSPITKASGVKRVVLARFACNRRLGDALFLQAFAALNNSPGARAFYDRQRARGAAHYQALRTLGQPALSPRLRSHGTKPEPGGREAPSAGPPLVADSPAGGAAERGAAADLPPDPGAHQGHPRHQHRPVGRFSESGRR
jgi:Transposase IS116/IS110/IS902 family